MLEPPATPFDPLYPLKRLEDDEAILLLPLLLRLEAFPLLVFVDDDDGP